MILGHLVYSVAIAIIFGMVYRRITGREYSWIIVLSAYAPDADIIADWLLKKIGITVLVYGAPIHHGDFHNLGVLVVYAVVVSFLLHPLGIRFADSFVFASVGFAAHLFEDALVFAQGYRMLWPLSFKKFGIGIFEYRADLWGIADKEVVVIGLILVGICVVIRTLCEGVGWIRKIFVSGV